MLSHDKYHMFFMFADAIPIPSESINVCTVTLAGTKQHSGMNRVLLELQQRWQYQDTRKCFQRMMLSLQSSVRGFSVSFTTEAVSLPRESMTKKLLIFALLASFLASLSFRHCSLEGQCQRNSRSFMGSSHLGGNIRGSSPLANAASLLFFHSAMSAELAGPFAAVLPVVAIIAVAEVRPLTTFWLVTSEVRRGFG